MLQTRQAAGAFSAMTANAFTEDMEKSKEAGMDEHLSKPVDIAVLAPERIQEKGQNCMAAVLSFLRIPVKNRSPPAPGRGV